MDTLLGNSTTENPRVPVALAPACWVILVEGRGGYKGKLRWSGAAAGLLFYQVLSPCGGGICQGDLSLFLPAPLPGSGISLGTEDSDKRKISESLHKGPDFIRSLLWRISSLRELSKTLCVGGWPAIQVFPAQEWGPEAGFHQTQVNVSWAWWSTCNYSQTEKPHSKLVNKTNHPGNLWHWIRDPASKSGQKSNGGGS